MNNNVDVIGVRFDNLNANELLELVFEKIDQGKKIRLAFSNPEFVIEATTNTFLKNYLNTCDYNVADGAGILFYSSLVKGTRLKERVTGTDFVPAICKVAEACNFRVAFFGAKPGIAKMAADNLKNMFSQLNVCATFDGYNIDKDIVQKINLTKPDILMVCLGNPKQEKWIFDRFDELDVKCIFGNGGALDFWAGSVQRAPALMQKLNLEWLYRLYQDPSISRLKRYPRLAKFIFILIADYLIVKITYRNV